MEALAFFTILIYLIALCISIWVITLIYSIKKDVRGLNEIANSEFDAKEPNTALFIAFERGDKEECKSILDENILYEFYSSARRYRLNLYDKAGYENRNLQLKEKYTKLYQLYELELPNLDRLSNYETYEEIFRCRI